MKNLVGNNIKFHSELNPKVWQGDRMNQRIRYHLLKIAQLFIKSLNIDNIPLTDIYLTGSLASYNYTPYSDFDLHIVLDKSKLSCDPKLLDKMFKSAKNLWNEHYPITIKGYDVELYAQDANEPHTSNGVYSVLDNRWVEQPQRISPLLKNSAIKTKTLSLMYDIDSVIKDGDLKAAQKLKDKISKMRKNGLEKTGMYGVENLSFKVLRNQGYLDKLFEFIKNQITQRLSLDQ